MTAQHRSHRGPRGCHKLLPLVAWSCLFRILTRLHTWCFQLCTTPTFTFGQFSEMGRLAILTDVCLVVDRPCKRQYLCSRRSEQMVIELDSHSRVTSPFSHPRGAQFAHFPGPEVLVYLLHHFCCCERAAHVVCKLWTIVCDTAAVSSPAAIKGKGKWS